MGLGLRPPQPLAVILRLIGPGAAVATLERRCRRKMYVGLGRKLAGAVSGNIGRKREWVGAKVPKWERRTSRKGNRRPFSGLFVWVSVCAIARPRVRTRRSLGERYSVSGSIGRKWEWVGAKVPKWEKLASRKGTAAHFRVCLFCVSACAIAWVRVHTRRSLGERYSVSGFPTIKWFPKGTAPPLTYK